MYEHNTDSEYPGNERSEEVLNRFSGFIENIKTQKD
jgi:hypothetical protein